MTNMKVRVNNIEMNVNDHGNYGEVIIFLHCSRGNSAQWNGVLPHFKEKYHVITLDLRGHGKSDKPEKRYHLEDMAKDVKSVMDELEIEEAHIVGSSMGGEIGVVLASFYPEKVSSLTCEGAIRNFFGANGYFDIPIEEISKQKEEVRGQLTGWDFPIFDSMEAMISAEKENYEKQNRMWNDYRRLFVEYDIYNTENMKYTNSCPNRVLLEYINEKFDVKFENYFKKINCPVLFLPSEEEGTLTEVTNSVNIYRDLVENSRVEIIKGSIHAEVMFDYPEEFSKTIISFHSNI